jgi:hypothetical protein
MKHPILMALAFSGGLAVSAVAQSPPPVPPGAPQPVPDWVLKYAGNQEQAARSCQILLSQEQTKVETLCRETGWTWTPDGRCVKPAPPAEPAKK